MCEKIKIKMSGDQIKWFDKVLSAFDFNLIENKDKGYNIMLKSLFDKAYLKIKIARAYNIDSSKFKTITFDIELFVALYKIMLVIYDFCEIYEQILIQEIIFNNIQPKLV